jgi:Protein of unknown function (DUF2384)
MDTLEGQFIAERLQPVLMFSDAVAWLNRPHAKLGGRRPCDCSLDVVEPLVDAMLAAAGRGSTRGRAKMKRK